MLLCFGEDERGAISLTRLAARVKGKDIDANELFIGNGIANVEGTKELKDAGVKNIYDGIKLAVSDIVQQLKNHFGTSSNGS
jgi:hypothetical protein